MGWWVRGVWCVERCRKNADVVLVLRLVGTHTGRGAW